MIGVHTPEFAFEKDLANVGKAVTICRSTIPVAIDNDYAIWRAFRNQYWPAHYFIDRKGRIRYHHFGEGEYERAEQVIRQLLAEDGQSIQREGSGGQGQRSGGRRRAPAMSLAGNLSRFGRGENFISPAAMLRNGRHRYDAPPPRLNQWGLSASGRSAKSRPCSNGERKDRLPLPRARSSSRARPSAPADPVSRADRWRASRRGSRRRRRDQGTGTVTEHRLYQLVRQSGPIMDHTFEIEFLDPGVQAFAFTFG